MKKLALITGLLLLSSMVFPVFSQGRRGSKGGQKAEESEPPPPPPDPTLAPQPKVKSQEEGQALSKLFQTQDSPTRIKLAQDFLAKFPNTEFKTTVLQVIALSYQAEHDFPNTVVYGEKVLESDPKSYQTLLMLAAEYVQNTEDTDLDMEEKLSKADQYCKTAIEAVKNSLRPNPQFTNEQWAMERKDFEAQAYETMGTAMAIRKNYPQSVVLFKQALEAAAHQEATTKIRLATAYNFLGQYDEAIAVLDDVLADQQLNPAFRRVAEGQKLTATKMKAKK